jgi:hypothetical protein
VAVVDRAGAIEVSSFEGTARSMPKLFDAPGIAGVTWAPDGRRLAVARRVDQRTALDIEIIDSTTGKTPAIGSVIETVGYPAYVPMSWAPAGDRLLLALPVSGNAWDLVVVDVPTGDQRVLARGFQSEFWGGWDAWAVSDEGGSGSMAATTTELAWTPDGSHVAISAQGSDMESSLLTVFDVEAGSHVELPIAYGAARPGGLAWTSDGSRLGFIEGSELVTVSPDGTDRSAQEVRVGEGESRGWSLVGIAGAPGDGFLVAHEAPAGAAAPAPAPSGDELAARRLQLDRFPAAGDETPTTLAFLDHPGSDFVPIKGGTCIEGAG